MTKPIIAIDIDDVLVDSATATLAAYNAAWGTTATLADYYTKPDPLVWRTDNMQEVVERVHVYQASPAFFELLPIQEAIAGMRQLAKHYELHAVTGRWDLIMEPTQLWLDQHFPETFASLTSVNFFHSDKSRSKGDICLELGASYLIDDHLKHCVSVADAGLEAVLFGNYPWNAADELPAGITRCDSWTDVLEYFDARVPA